LLTFLNEGEKDVLEEGNSKLRKLIPRGSEDF